MGADWLFKLKRQLFTFRIFKFKEMVRTLLDENT